jgi:hypothetical protein
MMFNRDTYFDAVRESVFGGSMNQDQVNGQRYMLAAWELWPAADDMRYFAYMLATTYHETAATMMPIEEYGHGSGHEYGEEDPETGQTYYGRGFVQLTWRDNYARATNELGLVGDDDIEWNAPRALNPVIAARVMGKGMVEGWFTGKKLPDYFNQAEDDAVGARKIINPDDKGPLVAGYHENFLVALNASWSEGEPQAPEPEPDHPVVTINIDAPPGVEVKVNYGPLL